MISHREFALARYLASTAWRERTIALEGDAQASQAASSLIASYTGTSDQSLAHLNRW